MGIETIAALVAPLVGAAIGAFLNWYSTYRQGRLAERVAGLEATLQKEYELDKAVEDIRGRHTSSVTDRLRGPSGSNPPSAGASK